MRQAPTDWTPRLECGGAGLEALPVDKSVLIDGLVVWKIRRRDGQVLFSGEKDFASVDEVMQHRGLEAGAARALTIRQAP